MADKKATIKQVAQLAGVSTSTVSRVINGRDPKVARKEVQTRIWDAVRQLDYTPNLDAQNLKKNKNLEQRKQGRQIGIVFARDEEEKINPFFIEIARHFEKKSLQLGYNVKFSVRYEKENPKKIKHIFDTYQVEGMLILGKYSPSLLKMIKESCSFYVYSGLQKIQQNGFDQIICDGYQASVATIQHLNNLGHRKISYLGEIGREARYIGYKDAMKTLGLPCPPSHILSSRFTVEGGYKAILKNIHNLNVTAIFCGNDWVAMGALKALKEHGIRVPEDISLISIDDIEDLQEVTPLLSTVRIPVEDMGKMAAKVLIDRMEGERILPLAIELPYTIINRESCKPIT